MVLYGLLLVCMTALLCALVRVVDCLVDLFAQYLVLLPIFFIVHVHAESQVLKVEVLLVVQFDLLQQLLLLSAVKIAQLLRLEVLLVYTMHGLHVLITGFRIWVS